MNYWSLHLPDGTALSGKSDVVVEGLTIPGFVIGSFDNAPGSMLTIPDTKDFSTALINPAEDLLYPLPDASTTRQTHEHNIQKAIDHHRRHPGKTVLSRAICTAAVTDANVVYDRLIKLYPDATVFHFSTAPTGTWVGASPELLLEAHDGVLSTMSLAGTRPAGSSDEWDHKNLEEQRIVTDFILDILDRHGLNAEPHPIETKRAGNIEHLMTRIDAPLPDDWSAERLMSLLTDLSPTPALGGYPREEALQLISRLEQHSRGYYGGYFGYVATPSSFRLNVNLRSAQLTPDATYIFAGGGITADSIPEDEWEETCRKANTVTLALV